MNLRSILTVVAILAAGVAGWWLRPAPASPNTVAASSGGEVARTAPTPSEPPAEPTAGSVPGEAYGEPYLGVVVAGGRVTVSAEAAGRVDAVLVDIGDTVQKGQELVRLDTESVTHQTAIEEADLKAAEARHRQSELELRRTEIEARRREELPGLFSREEREAAVFAREAARSQYEATEAEVTRARARLDELGTTRRRAIVRAPLTGSVAARFVEPGTVVTAASPVVRLIDPEAPLVRFAIPPGSSERVAGDALVNVRIEAAGTVFSARVRSVAPEIDGPSRMLFVEAELLTDGIEPRAMPPIGAVARVDLAG